MRESEFRGKRLDNEKWIYGDLLRLGGNLRTFIFTDEDCISQFAEKAYRLQKEVDPATVGQYTGLKDKNDKKMLFDPYSGFPAALLSRIIRRRLDMTIDHYYIRILPLPICKVHHGYRNAVK